jgi:hypothetical protein
MSSPEFSLLFGTSELPEKWVEGRWAPVRFHLNMHTGEFLNIGVIFREKRARKPLFKLTASMRPIECLMGSKARENLGFLLALVAERFAKSVVDSPSPQVSIGEWQFAQGESAEAVCEQLFESAVTIGKFDPVETITVEKTERYNYKDAATATLRSLWALDPTVAKALEQKKPMTARGRDNKEISISIPLRGPGKYGAFGSVWFKDETYRQANTDHPCMSLIAASSIVEEGETGKLFVWRPPENGTYGVALQNKIDEELDLLYVNLRQRGLGLEIETTPRALAKSVRNWALEAA